MCKLLSDGCRKLAAPAMVCCVCLLPVNAGDWPQILGPNRNGVAVNEKLPERWPDSGLDLLWQVSVGSGFAGAAVDSGRVIVFDRQGNEEVVRMLNAVAGREIWKSAAECQYRGGVSSDKGPRCVPLIHGDRVYVFGVEGRLRCLDMANGAEIWTVDTVAAFNPLEGYFGTGSTPVLAEQLLIVNVGGRGNNSVVAFDRDTGKVVWETFADAASYSSPVVASVDGVQHVLVVTRLHLLSLDPADGSIRFQAPFGARGPTVNGASPVLLKDHVFVSASYRIGSLLVRLETAGGTEIWRDPDLLATQYATPIAVGDLLFAVDGRQDEGFGSASVKCLDVQNRRVLWQQEGFDYGTLLNVSQDLLFLTHGGELIRFAASADRYQERQRVQVLQPTESGYRLPALADGRLYIRDDKTLKCLQVGISSP